MGYNNESIEELYSELMDAIKSGNKEKAFVFAQALKNAYYELEFDYEELLDQLPLTEC
jgi:hypothetical protein